VNGNLGNSSTSPARALPAGGRPSLSLGEESSARLGARLAEKAEGKKRCSLNWGRRSGLSGERKGTQGAKCWDASAEGGPRLEKGRYFVARNFFMGGRVFCYRGPRTGEKGDPRPVKRGKGSATHSPPYTPGKKKRGSSSSSVYEGLVPHEKNSLFIPDGARATLLDLSWSGKNVGMEKEKGLSLGKWI